MFEATQDKYSDGDVVWVKLGNCWWPGEVCGESRLPEELLEGLKKQPKVVVKFFQEDTFEYVFNLHHIFKYDCEKKNEFIKKGLDLYKAKHKYMEKFPADVTTAEQLTGGNPDIVNTTELVTPKKQKWLNIFQESSKKKKPKIKNIAESSNSKNRGRPVVNCSPKKTFTPSRKSDCFDYSSPSTSYSCSPVSTPSSIYKCHLCDFSSTGLNALMFHNRNFTHSAKIASDTPKFSNKKKINIKKIKERLDKEFQEYDAGKVNASDDDDDDDDEDPDDIIDDDASTSTTPKSQPKSKSITNRKRKRRHTKKDLIENDDEIHKKSKPYSGLQVSLLADWSEDESDFSLEEKSGSKKDSSESIDINEEVKVTKQPMRFETQSNETIKEKPAKSLPEKKDTSIEQKIEVPLTTTNKTKYRNIPKKERREFVIEETNENIVSNDDNGTKNLLLKSFIEKTVYENNNSTIPPESNVSCESVSQTVDNEKQKSIIKTDITVDLINKSTEIVKDTSITEASLPDSENLKNEEIEKKETKADVIELGENIKEENLCNVSNEPIVSTAEVKATNDTQNIQLDAAEKENTEILKTEISKLESTVVEDTNNTKVSDVVVTEKKIIHEKMSCFDFKEDEDESIILPKSPPRKRRLKKKDDEDDKSSDGENENNNSNKCEDNDEDFEKRDIKLTKEIDNLLSSTDVPILPELPDNRVIQNDDVKEISGKKKDDDLESKERALPPKERGKRIFKSRNRDKLIQESDATGESKPDIQPKLSSDPSENVKKTNFDLENNSSALSLEVVASTIINNNSAANVVDETKQVPVELKNLIDKALIKQKDVLNNYKNKNETKTIPLVPKKKHLQTALKEEAAIINNRNNKIKKIEELGTVVSIKEPILDTKIADSKLPVKSEVISKQSNSKSRDSSPIVDILKEKKTSCKEIECPVEHSNTETKKSKQTNANVKVKTVSPKSKIIDKVNIENSTVDMAGTTLSKFEPRTPKKRKQTQDDDEKLEQSKLIEVTTETTTIQPTPPKLAKQVINEQTPSTKNKKINLTASSSTSTEKNLNVQNINTIDDSIFDINSMPIVISNEPLTSESIENMPIVLASNPSTIITTKPSVNTLTEKKNVPTTSDDNIAIIMKNTNPKLIINKSNIKKIDQKSFISFSQSSNASNVFKNVTTIGQKIVTKPKINVNNPNFVIIPSSSSSDNNKQGICKITTSNVDINKKTINSVPISLSTAVTTTTSSTNSIEKSAPNPQVIISNQGVTQGNKNAFVKIPSNKIIIKSDNKEQLQKIVISSNKSTMPSHKPNILSSQTIVSNKNHPSNAGKIQSSSIVLPKGQIIQAGTGGQIVITSKGQIITTNTQTITTSKVLSITTSTRATEAGPKILSSASKIKSPAKIQVQSQKIICAPKVTTISTTIPSTKVTVQSQITCIEKKLPEVTNIASSSAKEKPIIHKKIIINKVVPKLESPNGQEKSIIKPSQSTVADKNKIPPVSVIPPIDGNSKVKETTVDRCKLQSKKVITKQPVKKSKVIVSSSKCEEIEITSDNTVGTELPISNDVPPLTPISDPTYTKVTKKIKLSPSNVNNNNNTIKPVLPDKIVEPVKLQQKKNSESPVLEKQIIETEVITDTIQQDDIAQCSTSNVANVVSNTTEPITTLAGNELETAQPIDSQLLALPGEGFGGPPNCFYLCTVGDNGNFIPIDNQPLYLDASNQLVPTPTDSISQTSILDTSEEIQSDLITNVCNPELIPSAINEQVITDLSQLQENQTYIINTGDGQQIIVDQQSLLALASGGELPQLMTADGQQLILQGLPQDILSAVTINSTEIDTNENGTQKTISGGLQIQAENRIMPWDEAYDDKSGALLSTIDSGQQTQNVDEMQLQTSNHDILAAALASTDVFPKDQSIVSSWDEQRVYQKLPLYSYEDKNVQYLGQQKLINQPITAHVSETNAVLHRPIMSTLEVPSTKKPKLLGDSLETGLSSSNINYSLAVMGLPVKRNVPKSLELPITITNPAIAPKTTSNPISLTTIYPTSTAAGNSLSSSQISPSLSIIGSISSELSFDILGGITTTKSITIGEKDKNNVSSIVTNVSNSSELKTLIDSNENNSINELKEDVTDNHNDNVDNGLSKIIILPASPKPQDVYNALSPFVEDSCSNSSEISLQPDLVLRRSDYQAAQQNIIHTTDDNTNTEQNDNIIINDDSNIINNNNINTKTTSILSNVDIQNDTTEDVVTTIITTEETHTDVNSER